MKTRLSLFVMFVVFHLLIVASAWSVTPVMSQPSTTPQTLTPIPLKPAVTTSPSTQPHATFLSTDDLNAVVETIFKDARFTANSCGGTSTERKTVLNMPNILFREEGMARLDYALTSNETDQTTYSGTQRLREIRACFKYWRSLKWGGMVANGKFVVVIQMVTDPNIYTVIEGRGRQESKADPFPVWSYTYEWGDNVADLRFADIVLNKPRLEIILNPAAVSGGIGFNGVESRWVIDSEVVGTPTHLDILKTKLINYKDSWMETLRMRILVAFSDPAVQFKLATGITEKFRTKHAGAGPINSITGVIGNGNTVTVQHN